VGVYYVMHRERKKREGTVNKQSKVTVKATAEITSNKNEGEDVSVTIKRTLRHRMLKKERTGDDGGPGKAQFKR